MHGVILLGLAFALALVAAGSGVALRWLPERLRGTGANGLLLLFTLAYIALGIEAYFYWFAVQSDGFDFSLAAQRWTKLYGGPHNSLGYRDVDHQEQDFQDKRLLVALGDSFTNGNGIRDYRDRFANRLGERLGPDWLVTVVARGGWDTADEHMALERYPHKPEVVVLQYYVNDIKDAVLAHGLTLVPSPPEPPAPIRPLVAHSYAVNFLYWRYVRLIETTTEGYWGNITRYYADETLWRDHEKAIRALIQYTRGHNIKLLPVVIPNLCAIEESRPITGKVVACFEKGGVPTIDLTSVLAGRDPQSLVCNPVDAHANEAVNAEIAELIFAKMRELGWVSRSE